MRTIATNSFQQDSIEYQGLTLERKNWLLTTYQLDGIVLRMILNSTRERMKTGRRTLKTVFDEFSCTGKSLKKAVGESDSACDIPTSSYD
jgi:hypothetical protein